MNSENEHKEKEHQLICMSIGIYEFFIAHGKGGVEAMLVYNHFIYTARLQKTNQVWAVNSYLSKGLNMGINRIQRAKTFLKKHGLIKYTRQEPTEERPYLGKVFINLPYLYKKETLKKFLEEQKIADSTTMKTIAVDESTAMKSTTMKSTIVDLSDKCLKRESEILKERKEMLKIRKKEEPDSFLSPKLQIFFQEVFLEGGIIPWSIKINATVIEMLEHLEEINLLESGYVRFISRIEKSSNYFIRALQCDSHYDDYLKHKRACVEKNILSGNLKEEVFYIKCLNPECEEMIDSMVINCPHCHWRIRDFLDKRSQKDTNSNNWMKVVLLSKARKLDEGEGVVYGKREEGESSSRVG